MSQIFKFDGDQFQLSQDQSLLREGVNSTLTSGAMYTLVGDLVMKYWSHNTGLTAGGDFAARDDSGTCTLIAFTEGVPAVAGNSLWNIYSAPYAAQGSVPSFAATPIYSMNLQTGSFSAGSLSAAGAVCSIALATPGAPTGTGSTSGGALTAQTYFAKVVAVDAAGGTTVQGAESAGVTTTGSASSITWQWNPVPGAVAYRLYLGTATGVENNFVVTTIPYYVQTALPSTFYSITGMSTPGTASMVSGVMSPYILSSAGMLGGNGTDRLATPGIALGTASTSGGTIAAGNNFCKVVAVDALLQLTAPGNESAAVVTSGSTSSIVWTWPTVPGAQFYRLYLGTSSGAEANYVILTPPPNQGATQSYTQTAAASTLTSGSPPTVNNTGMFTAFGDSGGNNAAAGIVGELIKSTVATPGASLTSATVANITSIALTPGDWDVSAVLDFAPASTTTITLMAGGINTVNNALLGQAGGSGIDPDPTVRRAQASAAVGANVVTVELPPTRVQITTNTTIYLNAQATFATSTMTCYGTVRARRMR